MRALAIGLIILLSGSADAAAADAPNLIGNWTRSDYSSATVGESPGYAAAVKPSLAHGADQGTWKMRIDAQDGPAFSGTLTGPSGRRQIIVGASAQDGMHFVFSSQGDTGSGTADGDALEYCWTISSARVVAAGCATFKRAK